MQISSTAREIIDGVMLSDGSIHYRPKRNASCIRLTQSPRRRGWVDQIRISLEREGLILHIYSYEKKETVWGDRLMRARTYDLLVSRNYESLNKERSRWYPSRKKAIPRDLTLTPLVLCNWFCGDGRGGDKKGTVGFCTDGFSIDDVDFLVHLLKRDLGITALRTVNHRGHPQILVSKRDEAYRVKEILDPQIPECCAYKFKHVRPLQKSGIGRRLPQSLVEEIMSDQGTCSMRTAADKHGVSVSKVWKLWQK